MEEDYITVYWAPGAFHKDEEQWTHIYAQPQSLSSLLRSQRIDDPLKETSNALGCPASNDLYKNIFVFNHTFDTSFDISNEESSFIYDNSNNLNYPFYLENRTTLSLRILRNPVFKNKINMTYNMSWLLFASEPVTARFTAPYVPPFSPAENTILSSGEFDIGKWYRNFVLDYQIPVGNTRFEFKEGDPMFYVEFLTDKKIIFKRYLLTETLMNLSDESAASPSRYGRFKSLAQRYSMSENSLVPQQVLKEIRNNLVE
jgi:hypothetical protein